MYQLNIFITLFILITHILIVLIDLRTFTIPNKLVLIGIFFKVLLIKETRLLAFLPSVLLALSFGCVAFFAPKYLGMGDAKYLLLLSLGSSMLTIMNALFYVSLFAIIFSIGAMIWQKWCKQGFVSQKIAFAPFLALGFGWSYLLS